jgi:hypothetical protein
VSPLSIDDLHALKSLAVQAMNRQRRAAEAIAGEDFLRALRIDGYRAQPQLGEQGRRSLAKVDEFRGLHERVGVLLDETLVAADPDRKLYPAAHERTTERLRLAAPAEATF